MSFIYCKNANNVEQHKEESEVTNLNSLRFKHLKHPLKISNYTVHAVV